MSSGRNPGAGGARFGGQASRQELFARTRQCRVWTSPRPDPCFRFAGAAEDHFGESAMSTLPLRDAPVGWARFPGARGRFGLHACRTAAIGGRPGTMSIQSMGSVTACADPPRPPPTRPHRLQPPRTPPRLTREPLHLSGSRRTNCPCSLGRRTAQTQAVSAPQADTADPPLQRAG